jgi:hypothetical protein
LEVIENENTMYQKLWNTAKAVLRGKFIAMSAYIKRTKRSQINDLMLHLKFIEKRRIRRIPRWQLEGGSKKRASYSEILERCQRHTLQA